MAYGKRKSLCLAGLLAVIVLTSCIPISSSTHAGRPRFNLKDYENESKPDPGDLEVKVPVRPDGLFQIREDYCLCRGGIPFMFSPGDHCVPVCADATGPEDQTPLLLGQMKVADAQLNISFEQFNGEFSKFCSLLLDLGNEKNLNCFGQLRENHNHNNSSEVELGEIKIGKNNQFQVLLSDQLRLNRVYSFRIQARSTFTHPETGELIPIIGNTDTIRFRVDDNAVPADFGGLLKINTAIRYHCIPRTGMTPNNYNHFFEQHFIFDAGNRPPIVPPTASFLLCHNDGGKNSPDHPSFPRLGEEVAFKVWDKRDYRFQPSPNSNEQSEININEFIKQRLLEKHSLQNQGRIALFHPLKLPRFPNISTQTENTSVNGLVGFYLKAFKDPDGDNFPICPSEIDLNLASSDKKFDPIFNVLGEFISATEAFYLALRTPRKMDPISQKFVDDIFFINEGLLKDIWFYYNDHRQPEFLDVNAKNFRSLVGSKDLYFYWPPYKRAPTIERPGQAIYKILSEEEIDREINGDSTLPPSPFVDRRLGCIPKTDN